MQTQIGQAVIFTDPVGQDHLALVTNDFGGSINVAYVSGDTARTDTFGRQLERATSVPHQSTQTAPGDFWRGVTETKRPDAFPQGAAQQQAAGKTAGQP